MSFQPQTISLAGLSWSLPRLPWRVSRVVQPELLALYRAAGGDGLTVGGVAALAAADLEKLGGAVHLALSAAVSGPKLTREQFDELPIGVRDLLEAFPAVARCAGLTEAPETLDPKAPEAQASTGTT